MRQIYPSTRFALMECLPGTRLSTAIHEAIELRRKMTGDILLLHNDRSIHINSSSTSEQLLALRILP